MVRIEAAEVSMSLTKEALNANPNAAVCLTCDDYDPSMTNIKFFSTRGRARISLLYYAQFFTSGFHPFFSQLRQSCNDSSRFKFTSKES